MRKHHVGVRRASMACVTVLAAVLAALPLLASQDTAAPATITVVVPADAAITFDGNPTTEMGTERQYVTPPLAAGKTFDYAIVARWTVKGQPVEKVRKITVTSGAKVRVDFLRKEGEAKPYPAEEAALVKKAEAFVDAFHKADAVALAAFWTPDGDYTDRNGQILKGREAIGSAFKQLFAENKGLKLQINSASLRFVTPEVAVEDGTTEVFSPDGTPPSTARYTTVHVKKDGEWFLGSLRDALYVPPTNYGHLHGLEWAIGDWAAEPDKGEVARASFAWSKNQNFIVSSIEATVKDLSVGGATQWIGWDPVAKKIRSWTFDHDGGFGEGTWTPEDNKWVIKTSTVLRDGKKLVATNLVTRIDADTVSWQSVERTVDGNALPDTPAVRMKRVK